MIRAHLATFPPRRRLLRRVTEAILPQVDHLFVVLNEYEEVPGFLAKDPRVTAVIPDRDVKDAGKFWFKPAADDIVFTIDDDIGYPPDYVQRTLDMIAPFGFDGNVFGYQGNAYAPGPESAGMWHNFLFHQELTETRGLNVIGTGTLCARGDAIPDLSVIEPVAGACDFGYATWLREQEIHPWALPRDKDWLSNDLPRNLRDSSLFRTVHQKRLPEHMWLLRQAMQPWEHVNAPFAPAAMQGGQR